eukprot:PhM_4_TR1343/c0_g1_i8/m.96630
MQERMHDSVARCMRFAQHAVLLDVGNLLPNCPAPVLSRLGLCAGLAVGDVVLSLGGSPVLATGSGVDRATALSGACTAREVRLSDRAERILSPTRNANISVEDDFTAGSSTDGAHIVSFLPSSPVLSVLNLSFRSNSRGPQGDSTSSTASVENGHRSSLASSDPAINLRGHGDENDRDVDELLAANMDTSTCPSSGPSDAESNDDLSNEHTRAEIRANRRKFGYIASTLLLHRYSKEDHAARKRRRTRYTYRRFLLTFHNADVEAEYRSTYWTMKRRQRLCRILSIHSICYFYCVCVHFLTMPCVMDTYRWVWGLSVVCFVLQMWVIESYPLSEKGFQLRRALLMRVAFLPSIVAAGLLPTCYGGLGEGVFFTDPTTVCAASRRGLIYDREYVLYNFSNGILMLCLVVTSAAQFLLDMPLTHAMCHSASLFSVFWFIYILRQFILDIDNSVSLDYLAPASFVLFLVIYFFSKRMRDAFILSKIATTEHSFSNGEYRTVQAVLEMLVPEFVATWLVKESDAVLSRHSAGGLRRTRMVLDNNNNNNNDVNDSSAEQPQQHASTRR